MSPVAQTRDAGPAAMDDEVQLDLAQEAQRASSVDGSADDEVDDQLVNGGQQHLAEVLEEERHRAETSTLPDIVFPTSGYRHLLQERDDASESGSADGLPRRAGSPIESLLSVPDDTPSIQVCFSSIGGRDQPVGHSSADADSGNTRVPCCHLPEAVSCRR